MSLRRNWFIYLSLLLYMAASVLILIFGISGFGSQKPYSYFAQAALLVGCFAAFIVINSLFYLVTMPVVIKLLRPMRRLAIFAEILIILSVLIMGLILRINYIKTNPVNMESDYKFYYDVAGMIKDHTLLEKSSNEYIALFPHTFGYSYLLSIVLRIFGEAPEVCLYFNAVLSVLTALFCYGIGRYLAGRVAGIASLIITCFWPSQIIFSNINGSEAAFCFFLYGAALLMVVVMRSCNKTSRVSLVLLLHLLIGILLSIASAIRPMSFAFFLALILCFIFFNQKLTYQKSITELSVSTIFLSKGIFRAAFIILGYVLCSQFISAGISVAIQKEVAGSGATGYSLMVGLHTISDGGHSEETMDFLFDTYKETGSANETNRICMDKAIEEVEQNPQGILELMAKKFYLIWSNDDYATTTNIVTMNNQGLLTPQKEASLYHLADISNIYYLFIVFLSIIGAGYLFFKDNNAQVFAVFFVGAVVMHLLVEMQNRYHYYLLQNFAIMAAVGMGFLFNRYLKQTQMKMLIKSGAFDAFPVSGDTSEAAATLEKQRVNDLAVIGTNELKPINIIDAIKEGHITITATKAYQSDGLAVRAEELENIETKKAYGKEIISNKGETVDTEKGEDKKNVADNSERIVEEKEVGRKGKAEERKAKGDKGKIEEGIKIGNRQKTEVKREPENKKEPENIKVTENIKVKENKKVPEDIKVPEDKKEPENKKEVVGKREEEFRKKRIEVTNIQNKACKRNIDKEKSDTRKIIGNSELTDSVNKAEINQTVVDKKSTGAIPRERKSTARGVSSSPQKIDKASNIQFVLSEQELQEILENSIREFSKQVIRVLLDNSMQKPTLENQYYNRKDRKASTKKKLSRNHVRRKQPSVKIKHK